MLENPPEDALVKLVKIAETAEIFFNVYRWLVTIGKKGKDNHFWGLNLIFFVLFSYMNSCVCACVHLFTSFILVNVNVNDDDDVI